MDSDLRRLFRLAHAVKRQRLEEFTTEALRKAIRTDGRPFVRLLQNVPASAWTPTSGSLNVDLRTARAVDAETQEHVGWLSDEMGRIDLAVRLEDEAERHDTVWVEIKIDAPLVRHGPVLAAAIPAECAALAGKESRDQLDVYLLHRCLAKPIPNPVLITLARTAPLEDPAGRVVRDDLTGVTWSDLERAVRDTPSPDPWWEDLVEFLSAEQVLPVRPFTGEPPTPQELDRILNLFARANKKLKEQFPQPPAPMAVYTTGIRGHTEAQLRKKGHVGHTAGPLIWGFRTTTAGEHEWYVLIGDGGFPRIRLADRRIVEAAAESGGLPKTWSPVHGYLGDRERVFEKVLPFEGGQDIDLVVDWFECAFRELHDARMLEPHFDAVRAKL